MSMARSSRMLRYVNYRMKITLQDSRTLVGTFMAFDRHMNIVLGDTEEYRKLKSKKGQGISEEKEEKRTLGLIILRGDTVVSMTIEGPPPPEGDEKMTPGGPGMGKAAGRGLPMAPLAGAPSGLAGPIRGMGGPGPAMMQPMMQGQGFARPPMGSLPPPGMMMPGAGGPPRGPPGMPMPMNMPPMGMGMGGLPPPPRGMMMMGMPSQGPPGMFAPPPPRG